MKATYTKLKDETWGVRVTGKEVKSGDIVSVTKRNGDSNNEVIDRVLWHGFGQEGDEICLCTIRKQGQSQRAEKSEDSPVQATSPESTRSTEDDVPF